MVQFLLNRGADPRVKTKDGKAALQTAEEKACQRCVEILRNYRAKQATSLGGRRRRQAQTAAFPADDSVRAVMMTNILRSQWLSGSAQDKFGTEG